MNQIYKRIKLSLLAILVANCLGAQTITQLQQPCNHDGILVASIPQAPPVTYIWISQTGVLRQYTSNYSTDTLYNYSGANVDCYYTPNIGGPNFYIGNYNSQPFSYSATIIEPLCPATLGTGSVAITGGQAPFSINWYDPSGSLVATGQNVSLPLNGYTVTITDANGCQLGSADQYDSLGVFQISPVSFSVTTTPANCTNGTASVSGITGGTPPYTYLWSNGQSGPTISNLISQYYYVSAFDAQGCAYTNGAMVSQAVTINANAVPTAATCLQNDGSIITFGSGGNPPYSYLYNNGQVGQVATNLISGNYQVQVTDANGCMGQNNSIYVAASTPITVTYTQSISSCSSPTGSASLTISGGQAPYTVTWATSPPQSGPVLNSVYGGQYYFNVTDANGCAQSGNVYVASVSDLAALPYAISAICPANNGWANANATSSFPPITYLWNTGATTPGINGLSPGNYSCVITDATGCQLQKSLTVGSFSPINISFATNQASCIFTSDGAITSVVTGGSPPYAYSWSGGQSTAAINGLMGNKYYWLTVTDNNGCTKTDWVYLGYNAGNDSCYCTVTGTVYYDVNANCIKDPGEAAVQNILINNNNILMGYGINNYMFTDTSGKYSFILPTGNYNIQEVVQYQYPLSFCQSNINPVNITASPGCVYTVDFANGINPLHDIHVFNLHLTLPVPGNSYVQEVIVQNDGTVAENNIQLGYAHDGQMPFVSSSGISLTQPNLGTSPNWYDNTSISLNPGTAVSTLITYTVPTNIPLGTVVNYWDSTAYQAPMNNWLNDYTPWNNVRAFDTVVVGSFDPNVKEVSPKGIGPLGYITSNDTVLDYVIHFQNTGTYYATKIVVVDTLDADLDWLTLKPGYSNHNYVVTMDANGVVSFTFNNIFLPPVDMFGALSLNSIGTIAYSIHTKRNLPQGTQLKNSASIFFDYNQPVNTNTTINTINSSTGFQNIVKSKDGLMSLFPNPAVDGCAVKIASEENGAGKIAVYSMDGSLVRVLDVSLVKGDNLFELQLSPLAAGLYIVRTIYNDKMHSCKLSVVR